MAQFGWHTPIGKKKAALTFATLVCVLVQPATAQEQSSAYTDLDLSKCKHTPSREPEDYGSWRCRGYAGVAVLVGGADQRTTVSFGPRAASERASSQTLPGFNSVDKTKIEWRLDGAKGRGKPFATIIRWHVKLEEDRTASRGRVLVVTSLGKSVCHIGYVDGLANPDANALAREMADTHARRFDCGKDTRMIAGKQGESVKNISLDPEPEPTSAPSR